MLNENFLKSKTCGEIKINGWHLDYSQLVSADGVATSLYWAIWNDGIRSDLRSAGLVATKVSVDGSSFVFKIDVAAAKAAAAKAAAKSEKAAAKLAAEIAARPTPEMLAAKKAANAARDEFFRAQRAAAKLAA